MKKILLSSGCSFTADEHTWPNHTSKFLNLELLNVGMSSQGNGLISRKVIYNVEKLLETYKSDEILVGIMWSGIDRYDYYTDSKEKVSWGWAIKNNSVENPTNITENNYNWRIMNAHWDNFESKLYYENFHHNISSMLFTVEHILRIQWHLVLYQSLYQYDNLPLQNKDTPQLLS